MKLDFIKVLNIVLTGMAMVEGVKNAKGLEKADAVVEATPALVAALETGIGKDILEDAKVIQAERNAISAIVAFQNAIRDVKAAKGTGAPV